ncbi:MAG TPA: hypothetical protein VGD67_18475 [Pseudonocardiaceae bacterium]
MTAPDLARRRRTALVGGVLALVVLGATLAVWLVSPAAAARAPFGQGWARGVVVLALAVVAVGLLVVLARPRLPAPAATVLALLVALVNIAVGVLAVALVIGVEEQADVGLAVLLGLGVAGTNLVAGQVMRGAAPKG